MSYVDKETPQEVADKLLELVKAVKDGKGVIRKGANETTKSIERGLSKLTIIAADVSPEEVVMHIPKLCKEKNVAYAFVKSKEELGKAAGLSVSCAAVSIENPGSAKQQLDDILSRLTGTAQKK
ncbi:MAG: 50S ribosomal protein L7Ae [Candidatus Micrarchaeota archaeon]|nr:MAG: 50S ribosomal protein L7Ae [Candidatus Micrarchaeota archaeon]